MSATPTVERELIQEDTSLCHMKQVAGLRTKSGIIHGFTYHDDLRSLGNVEKADSLGASFRVMHGARMIGGKHKHSRKWLFCTTSAPTNEVPHNNLRLRLSNLLTPLKVRANYILNHRAERLISTASYRPSLEAIGNSSIESPVGSDTSCDGE